MKYSTILLALFFASSASAQFNNLIQQFSGQLSFLQQPPVSVELDALVSDTLLFMFIEKENHILTNDVILDLSEPGDYFDDSIIPDSLQTWDLLNPGVITAGTEVHSIYFHYDNETYNQTFNLFNYLNCIGQYQVNAQITFNYPVLGIIMRAGAGAQDHLGISNAELGIPTVEYDEDNFMSFPGINITDGCQSDRFILSADRMTLTLKNNTDIHHDNYRVVLGATSPLSVKDNDMKVKIKYFPNPTGDIVNFEIDNLESYNYIVTNQVGQRVSSGKLNNDIKSVSLTKYPSGIYYITLSNGQSNKTIKIVKY